MSNWKHIGTIGKARSLNGDFSISGSAALLPCDLSGQTVRVGKDPKSAREFKIGRHQVVKERDRLCLVGIADRTAVEALAGTPLWVTADLASTEPFIGKQVVDADGILVGEIIDHYNYGASDVFKVQSSNGTCLDLPFVPNYFASKAVGNLVPMCVPIAMFGGLHYLLS